MLQGFSFTFVVAIFSTLTFALIPALQVTRSNVTSRSRKENSRTQSGRRSHHLRRLLVIAQVAFVVCLLSRGRWFIDQELLLMLRSNQSQASIPSTRSSLKLILPKAKYPEPEKHRQFFEQILPKLAALPEWKPPARAFPMPFSNNDSGSAFCDCRTATGNLPDKTFVASHLTIYARVFSSNGDAGVEGKRVFKFP